MYIIESMYNTHSCSYIMNLKCRSSSSSSVDEVSPAMKRRGDEKSQRQNDWRQSVPTTKWLATKRRRNVGDERRCTPFSLINLFLPLFFFPVSPFLSFTILLSLSLVCLSLFLSVLVMYRNSTRSKVTILTPPI